eukprot:1129584_1
MSSTNPHETIRFCYVLLKLYRFACIAGTFTYKDRCADDVTIFVACASLSLRFAVVSFDTDERDAKVVFDTDELDTRILRVVCGLRTVYIHITTLLFVLCLNMTNDVDPDDFDLPSDICTFI